MVVRRQSVELLRKMCRRGLIISRRYPTVSSIVVSRTVLVWHGG